MNNTMILLVAAEAKHQFTPEMALKDQFLAAFKSAQNHWMAPDDNTAMMGGVAAVFENADEETKARITQELETLRALNAMVSGVPVDMERLPKVENPIGIIGLWHEARKSA